MLAHALPRRGTNPSQLLRQAGARVGAGGSPAPPERSHPAHQPATALATAKEMKANPRRRSRASTDTIAAARAAADLSHTLRHPLMEKHHPQSSTLPIAAAPAPLAQGCAESQTCPGGGAAGPVPPHKTAAKPHGERQLERPEPAKLRSPSRQHARPKTHKGNKTTHADKGKKKNQPARVFSDKGKQIDL